MGVFVNKNKASPVAYSKGNVVSDQMACKHEVK